MAAVLVQTWLFGGRSVLIPCSHAAHQERPNQREYRNSWIRQKYRNYKRLVEVWFDGYKKYFYKMYPELVVRVLVTGHRKSLVGSK